MLNYNGAGCSHRSAFGQHAHVGDIRGRGLFRAIELVEDRASKRPFDPARKLHAKIKSAAMERGLVVYPAGGTVDGKSGDHVLIAPPFIIEDGQIDELVYKLSRSGGRALVSWGRCLVPGLGQSQPAIERAPMNAPEIGNISTKKPIPRNKCNLRWLDIWEEVCFGVVVHAYRFQSDERR